MSVFKELAVACPLIRFEELAEAFLTDQAAGEHLEPFFNGMPVANITDEVVLGYVRHRMVQGANTASINAELLALGCMLGQAATAIPPRISHVPRIPTPDEVKSIYEKWREPN